ncbi:MAG: putative integrase [Acidianus sp.]|nr:putative integrase [Acidianus sp.]
MGPLDKIIETYIAGCRGCAPTMRVRGFEPRMAFASGS